MPNKTGEDFWKKNMQIYKLLYENGSGILILGSDVVDFGAMTLLYR